MDSLSQFALGAAIGIAVMRGRTRPWKAALIGGLAGTLPDLDAFYDHGDPVSNVTLHRANSHALFWLTLASPAVAFAGAAILRERHQFRRWWLAVWLALVTHPILDWFTVYGTQILRPFTDFPYAVGSIFIIDPLYTLPLLIGIGVALILRNERGWRWNIAGLILSTLYLGWGVFAQAQVRAIAEASLASDGRKVERLLVTPTAFNTLLWRVVAMTPDGYLEGFRSLLDRDPRMTFDAYPRGEALYGAVRDYPSVARVAWFTQGLFKMSERDGKVIISDLRMGQEPYYSFNFVVGERQSPTIAAMPPVRFREQHEARTGIRWLWRRMWGNPVPPPK
ncbi:MAG: metal-dependent hydrolase [Pseudorhodoplanes sp.]|uniref:metal-dependent hydrolase n=1 Tax=Pseudorhodoplanes sp. TaxID=1934341 RepID=UPI003D0AE0EA